MYLRETVEMTIYTDGSVEGGVNNGGSSAVAL